MSTAAHPIAAPAPAQTTHPGESRPHKVWRLLLQAGKDWQADNAMRLSAAMSMYSILSLAPLLVITIKVVGLVLRAFGEEDAAADLVQRQAASFLGPRGAAAIKEVIDHATRQGSGWLATAVSLLVLLFTASGVFLELRGSFNALWGISPKQHSGWWAMVRERFLSIGMVLAIGLLLLITQLISTTLTVLSEYVAGGAGWAAVVVDVVASTVLITLLFALMFRFLPDARVPWRYVWAGAFVTAVLFKVGQFLQSLYFTYVSTQSAYGAAASFMVVMLWVYYSSWILFFGAELIKVYAQDHGLPIGSTTQKEGCPPGGPSGADPGKA